MSPPSLSVALCLAKYSNVGPPNVMSKRHHMQVQSKSAFPSSIFLQTASSWKLGRRLGQPRAWDWSCKSRTRTDETLDLGIGGGVDGDGLVLEGIIAHRGYDCINTVKCCGQGLHECEVYFNNFDGAWYAPGFSTYSFYLPVSNILCNASHESSITPPKLSKPARLSRSRSRISRMGSSPLWTPPAFTRHLNLQNTSIPAHTISTQKTRCNKAFTECGFGARD